MLENDDDQQHRPQGGQNPDEPGTPGTAWWNGVVTGDEPTLPESLRAALVRAGFGDDDASGAMVDEQLDSPVPRARVLALRAAARRRRLDAGSWTRAITDATPVVRREALALYAHHTPGDDTVLATVVRALGDPDALVVDAAAFALGEHQFADAVEPLVAVAAHHADARCREAAVAALGMLGDERGRAAVLAALEDRPPVRRRAVVALANYEGPDVDAALARAREDRDWQVRAAAVQLGDDDD
ncbi:MAG: HEAT repeat domain-containing protein [Acidimicrobiales bacterium]